MRRSMHVRASVFWLDDQQSQAFHGIVVVFLTDVPSVWRRLVYGKEPEPLSGLVASSDTEELTVQLDALQPNTAIDTGRGGALSQMLLTDRADGTVLRATFIGHKEFGLAAGQPSAGTLRGWTEQVYAHTKPAGG